MAAPAEARYSPLVASPSFGLKVALTYNPAVFDVRNLDEAMKIILTAEGGVGTEERWRRETPYLAQLLGGKAGLTTGQLVLDYGCGIGRMAKALIESFGVAVIGVDISASMRALSPVYVESERFSAVSPAVLDLLIDRGLRVDAAISVWVLQHCLTPADDVARIAGALRPGGQLAVVNNLYRAVPTVEGVWGNDGIDIKALVAGTLPIAESGGLDAAHVGDVIAGGTYWAVHAKP
jgi:SAM-dependent methyltransferase